MDPAGAQPTLLEAARTVARGRDLEAQLAALADLARSAGGAQSVAIHLLDPVGRWLVPAAAAGGAGKNAHEAPTIPLDDGTSLAAGAARDRRSLTGSDSLAVPLIVADHAGGDEVEGVLVATFAGSPPGAGEADDMLTALADLAAVAIRKARLQHALVEKAEWIERLASTDALTGIANRATFERMLELEIARANRQGSQLSVVLIDIDDFTGLNQRGGAQAGDDALRRVASLLADQVRLVDTIGRLGADEFGVIAPGGGGAVVARRVGDAAGKLSLSLSAGVVVLPDDGGSGSELMAAAQASLDAAKSRGPGSIVSAGEVRAS